MKRVFVLSLVLALAGVAYGGIVDAKVEYAALDQPSVPERAIGWSDMVGYTAYALAEPESGFGVTVLMNSAFGLRLELARFALACLRAEAAGLALPQVPEPADPEVVRDAASYAGTFVDEGGAVTILAEGDGLVLERDGWRAPLVPLDADRFVIDDPARDRYPFDVLREDGIVTQAFWGPRWLRHERYSGPASFEHPAGWTAFTGRYRTWNPWAGGFEVTLRRGRLWLGRASCRERV